MQVTIVTCILCKHIFAVSTGTGFWHVWFQRQYQNIQVVVCDHRGITNTESRHTVWQVSGGFFVFNFLPLVCMNVHAVIMAHTLII